MTDPVSDDRVAAVRSFNRFFTRQIGVLREGLLHSEFTLTEMRVLYELAHHGDQQPAALCRNLGLDRGYLSRIVARFETAGLVAKVASATDGRAKLLRMTAHGRAVYEPLDRRSRDEVGDMLARFEWKADNMRAAIEPAMYATDVAIEQAAAGVPFRDAYRAAAETAASAGEGRTPEASLAARTSPGAGNDLMLDMLRARLAQL